LQVGQIGCEWSMGFPHLTAFIIVIVPLPKQVSQRASSGIVVSIVFAPRARGLPGVWAEFRFAIDAPHWRQQGQTGAVAAE
jgi:hypothetical protein